MAKKPPKIESTPQSEVADRTGIKAGFISRAVAMLIDIVIILVAAGITYLLVKGSMTLMRIDLASCTNFVPLVDVRSFIRNFCALTRYSLLVAVLSIAPLYLLSLWLFAGRTVGMGIVGIRIVRSNGRPVHLVTVLVRLVGFTVSLFTLGLGFLWVIIDDDRQGLHDKMAGTYVIYWSGKLVKARPVPPKIGAQGASPVPVPVAGKSATYSHVAEAPQFAGDSAAVQETSAH